VGAHSIVSTGAAIDYVLLEWSVVDTLKVTRTDDITRKRRSIYGRST
jgi:hypothetical protein